jgi:hypothetical protein
MGDKTIHSKTYETVKKYAFKFNEALKLGEEVLARLVSAPIRAPRIVSNTVLGYKRAMEVHNLKDIYSLDLETGRIEKGLINILDKAVLPAVVWNDAILSIVEKRKPIVYELGAMTREEFERDYNKYI